MKNDLDMPSMELDYSDEMYITEIFFRDVVVKLQRLNARNGNLNCSFAGEKYENWSLRFKSSGSSFEIVEFEYDEDSASMDLDI